MSPRKSSALDAIEAQVCREVGRGVQALLEASRGGLAEAAQSLVHATSIGFITGFFVPRDGVAAAETDGPVGTALLAASLGACGVPVRIAVDSPCADAVRAAVHETCVDVAVDEMGVEDQPGILRVAGAWRDAGETGDPRDAFDAPPARVPRPQRAQHAPRDPFFDQPYQPPANDAAPAWEAAVRPAGSRSSISANIKTKRKVAALFKSQ